MKCLRNSKTVDPRDKKSTKATGCFNMFFFCSEPISLALLAGGSTTWHDRDYSTSYRSLFNHDGRTKSKWALAAPNMGLIVPFLSRRTFKMLWLSLPVDMGMCQFGRIPFGFRSLGEKSTLESTTFEACHLCSSGRLYHIASKPTIHHKTIINHRNTQYDLQAFGSSMVLF